MRSISVVVLLLLVATSATAQSAPGQRAGAQDAERTAVQQLIVKMAENIQAGNMTAVDSLFGRGGHILTDTSTLHGWSEYRDGQLKSELARYTNLKFEHTAVEAVVRGDVAWVAFRQVISGMVASAPVRVPGRATAVLEKKDGRWIIVHLHVSR